jgi:AcrR family transcriptional regulator
MASAPTSVVNKHQQRTELTRRKLLKSARRIFARDGFEAARIEDIAQDAGHSRGAFYANFASKEDLFFALLEQQATERLARVQEFIESCSSNEQRLTAVREFYINGLHDRQWSLLMLEFKLFALRHAQLRPKLLRTHRRVRASISLKKLKLLLPADLVDDNKAHEFIRRALEATLHALVLEHAYDPAALSEQQVFTLLGQIFDLLVQPVKSHPPKKN